VGDIGNGRKVGSCAYARAGCISDERPKAAVSTTGRVEYLAVMATKSETRVARRVAVS
jgi:hypothetical protein